MKAKIRSWFRYWIPRIVSFFEPKGRKGKWFEERYYTHLFTRSEHYSKPEPNEEETERLRNIEELVGTAISLNTKSFSQIIDFGCGRGWLSKELSRYGKLTGIEPISKVIEYGRKLYPGLDLRAGDIETLSKYRADLIVCSEVVEHIGKNRLPEYFAVFHDVLEEGGFLIITTPRLEAYAEWASYAELDQPTEDWLTESELKEFAENADFREVKKIIYGSKPHSDAPVVQVYQQWLFRR